MLAEIHLLFTPIMTICMSIGLMWTLLLKSNDRLIFITSSDVPYHWRAGDFSLINVFVSGKREKFLNKIESCEYKVIFFNSSS